MSGRRRGASAWSERRRRMRRSRVPNNDAATNGTAQNPFLNR
jgi:hypothetical protein